MNRAKFMLEQVIKARHKAGVCIVRTQAQKYFFQVSLQCNYLKEFIKQNYSEWLDRHN